jgi:hypothetical protein
VTLHGRWNWVDERLMSSPRLPRTVGLDARLEHRLAVRAAGGDLAILMDLDRDAGRDVFRWSPEIDGFDHGYGHGV